MFAIIALGLVVLMPLIIYSINQKSALGQHIENINKAANEIVYLDEVLTNSARMYVFTQAPSWIARYDKHAARLDDVLADAEQLDDVIAEAIRATSDVNGELIAIETQAFLLASEGKQDIARQLMFNQLYEELKKQYSDSVLLALQKAEELAKSSYADNQAMVTQALISIFVVLVVAFISTLFYLFRHFYHTDVHHNHLMDSLQEKVSDLENSKQELIKANSSKSLFLANMSHEIRTPMNGIYGNLQLLQETQLSEEAKQVVENATQSAKMLSLIVNDILDFSKIEANKLSIEKAVFDFRAIISEIEHMFAKSCADKGIHYQISNHLSNAHRIGDSLRIKQIILNLVSNAVKFTHQGEVVLEVTESAESNIITIRVRDTGIGMGKNALDVLFKQFEQADNSTTRNYGGTGLGMPIVKSLIDLMKGTIDVESETGKGTHITVQLPLDIAANTVSTQGEDNDWASLKGAKILVAEDNKVNQAVVSAMLKSVGCEMTLVENGQLAVDWCEQNQVDLILMDIHMPELDGIGACRAIKSKYPSLPIVALTASVLKGDVEQYKAAGFDHVVGKPIDKNRLFWVMDNHLKDK
jgi:signal transduction histidine kinase